VTDLYFEKKLPLYRTAWSPLYETFVGIKKVRQDDTGRYILDCTIAGYPEDQIVLFRPEELERYVL
jgi:hypothetical protein